MTATVRASTPAPAWDRLRTVENFGHSLRAPGFVFQPVNEAQVRQILAQAQKHGYRLALRGSGRSYGDAALAAGHWVLDLRRMNRILAWDPQQGRLTVEPGVTIEDIWRYTLADGWWPAVVPGTMRPTAGGCAAMNVHGKNNWQAGTWGEHIVHLRVLTPTGQTHDLTPADDAFWAVLGGLGVLGVITQMTLQLKPVASGDLEVRAWATPNLSRTLADLDAAKEDYEYVVAWVDATARGRARGRGQLHAARHIPASAEPFPHRTLDPAYQMLPDTFFGLVPKAILWRFMRLFMHNPGVRLVNAAKYWASRTVGHEKTYRQSLVAFNFLLDYVPHWERAYGPGGLIQYQIFVPAEAAERVFDEVLRRTQSRGVPSYLAVIKRHRPDRFWLSHAVDGFSLALDFPVRPRRTAALLEVLAELDRLVLDAGGRFYFAKDATLDAATARAFLGADTVQRFLDLKAAWDPDDLLQSDLYRRVFRPRRPA
ncbi:MAG: FAD-binding oxidoreductase [Chloroflexi bacterium]|nr:FAD-binding oxidoreductase [Chloroflexota bacterium]